MRTFILLLLICCGFWYMLDKDEEYQKTHPVDYSSVEDITDSFKQLPDSVKGCKVYKLINASGNNRITLVKCPHNDVETTLTPVLKQSDKVQVTIH